MKIPLNWGMNITILTQLNFDVNKIGVLLVLPHYHGNPPDMEVS
jgi:hypothetical protein